MTNVVIVLALINQAREAMGLKELVRMPIGIMRDSEKCPVARGLLGGKSSWVSVSEELIGFESIDDADAVAVAWGQYIRRQVGEDEVVEPVLKTPKVIAEWIKEVDSCGLGDFYT